MADERQPPSRREDQHLPGSEERTAHHPSDVDALGRDKRRRVVGGQYGATVRKRLTVYGIFLAVLAAIVIVFLTVVSGIDNRDIPLESTAPWSQAGVAQVEPRPVDFPENGPDNTIPRDEIGQAVPPSISDVETGN